MTAGSKPSNAARNVSRLRRIVDHDRPAWKHSRMSRSNSSTSSWQGTPHSSSWYVTMSGSGRSDPAPDHQQRGRSSIIRARSWHGPRVDERAAHRRVADRSGGIEHGPEDVPGDDLRAGRADERDADEPARDASAAEVEPGQ